VLGAQEHPVTRVLEVQGHLAIQVNQDSPVLLESLEPAVIPEKVRVEPLAIPVRPAKLPLLDSQGPVAIQARVGPQDILVRVA